MLKGICLVGATMLFVILSLCLVVVFTGCTYSINNVQTEGEASDVVDETQTNDPNIAPSLTVPLSL